MIIATHKQGFDRQGFFQGKLFLRQVDFILHFIEDCFNPDLPQLLLFNTAALQICEEMN